MKVTALKQFPVEGNKRPIAAYRGGFVNDRLSINGLKFQELYITLHSKRAVSCHMLE
jgi:hypothetical protein